VKTDRRDAEKLARCYRAGELTPVWVPDADHEALRDLVRAREAAKKDQLRQRHRLGKFLLRHGKRPTDAGKAWTQKYLNWIRIHVHFEQPALEATLKHYRGRKSIISPNESPSSSKRSTRLSNKRLPKFGR